MAAVYFHYPFCKQACHYCNFHFSTSLRKSDLMIAAMLKELNLRSSELNSSITSIYFGGGSPSLMRAPALAAFLEVLSRFEWAADIEITVEVNPDDVTAAYLSELKSLGVNRLSVGIQSFHQKDLILMNRAHDSTQALNALELIAAQFENFSLDLIYGMPQSTPEEWHANVQRALGFNPPHISAYALTVEEKTTLHHWVEKAKVILLDESAVEAQYHYLVAILEEKGFDNYEFSNFGKPNFYSKNNTNYWLGGAYVGIGPSAHSYDGAKIRSWNVSNNPSYLKSMTEGILPMTSERLKKNDRFNEYIMTGLRTQWGVSLDRIRSDWGDRYAVYLEKQAEKHLTNHQLFWDGDQLKISKSARFLTDGLAADFFLIDF